MPTASRIKPLPHTGAQPTIAVVPRASSTGSGSWRQARARSSSLLLQFSAQTRLDIARFSARAVWTHLLGSAFQTLAVVLVNAAVSVSFSWLSAFTFSRGNVLSGLSPSAQSPRSFLVGVLLCVHVWFCTAVCVSRSFALFRLELVSRPGRPMGAVRSLTRMVRHTARWFLFTGLIIAGIGFGIGSLDPSFRKYRLELYACSLWYYSYVPIADQAARRIYRQETVEGLTQQPQPKQQPVQVSHPGRHRRSPLRRFVRGFLANGSLLVSLLVPTIYVHVISFMGAITSTRSIWLFTIASLVLKMAMQELAKIHIVRRKIQNARAMAILVAVPTVLIDTQVRIVLLRFQNVRTTMATTCAIAFAEICVRMAKAWLVRWHTRRQRRLLLVTTVSGAATDPDELQRERDHELWKAQLLRYHAIEVSADMYAEYLAIGCSSAIMVVLGNHPQFLFSSSTSAGSTWTSVTIHVQLLAQIAVEVVVDLVSCVVEVASGLTFVHVDRERGYLLALCVTLALVNVNTSAILYLAY